MTEPAEFNEATDRFVLLAGRNWPVPDLVPRQMRHIRGPLREMNQRLAAATDKHLGQFINLAEEDYERLLLRPVHQALTRAHPGLTFEEFLDWPVKETELLLAWFKVREASGLFVMAAEGEKPAGEAPAADQTNQTGT